MAGRPSENASLVLCWSVDRSRAVVFVATQLQRSNGIVADAANSLGIHRRTLHRWILADKTLARTVKQARKKE